jgi:hypothetical protein
MAMGPNGQSVSADHWAGRSPPLAKFRVHGPIGRAGEADGHATQALNSLEK